VLVGFEVIGPKFATDSSESKQTSTAKVQQSDFKCLQPSSEVLVASLETVDSFMEPSVLMETSLAFAFEEVASLDKRFGFPAACSLASPIADFWKKPFLDLSSVNSFETHEGHRTSRCSAMECLIWFSFGEVYLR